MIKNTIKRYLRKRGYVIVPVNEYQEMLQPVKKNWLKEINFSSIVDIGASDGGFARKTRESFPTIQIFSFEPIKESFERLNENFKNDNNFSSFNIACTNTTGESTFFVSSNSGSSSLLEMGKLHKEAYPESASLNEIKVLTDKLDNVLSSKETGNNVFMKLDVQGSEILVFEGAALLLKSTRLLLVEISFVKLYESQPLANEVISYLKNKGFIIAGIENVSQSLVDGTFLQADMYFIRESAGRNN